MRKKRKKGKKVAVYNMNVKKVCPKSGSPNDNTHNNAPVTIALNLKAIRGQKNTMNCILKSIYITE